MDLDLSGHVQLGRVQVQHAVQPTKEQDHNDDRKIAYQGAELECREQMEEKIRRGHSGADTWT